ncbi:hypothetical protein [Pedobacter westerhofensis]|uniref:hypothetical protein n=1 Tax=Pedobacter westerhofensis TaxID=425512 RepID=UPI00163DD890|nr:hypothetical protein [Pedobacter westerhofensis]
MILSQPAAKNINVLLNAVNKGMEIKVDKVFPFSQSGAAYQYTERDGVTGKVVIEL